VRNAEGDVEAVVEEKDATPAQREIREINSGIFAFDGAFLADALSRITNDNAKGEYYLTELVQLARDAGLTVGAHVIDDVMQTEGANDRAQLAELGRELNRRIVTRWMHDGVTVMDPATTWIDADVELAPDVTILPGTQLLGATVVAEDAVIGPDTTLKDCEVGPGARVVRTHAELAVIGERATVGPFSYLRPGTNLGAGGKIGAFVEVKNAQIGDRAKVPHLSYVGDAEIGDSTTAGTAQVAAHVTGGTGTFLQLWKNGDKLDQVEVTSDDFRHTFEDEPGKGNEVRYRAELINDANMRVVVTSHIYVTGTEAGGGCCQGSGATGAFAALPVLALLLRRRRRLQ